MMMMTIISAARAGGQRRAFSSFYDSQSATTVVLNDKVFVTDCTNHNSSSSTFLLNHTGNRKWRLGFDVILSDEAVWSREVRFDDDKASLQDALSSIEAQSKIIKHSRILLTIDAAPDYPTLQLYAATLCDGGADSIILDCVDSPSIDADDLEEAVDSLCEVDLLGIPMHGRLGISTLNPTLIETAIKNKVLRFDTCMRGVNALKPSELRRALDELGKSLKHDVTLGSVDELLRAEDEFCRLK
jgi:hypothetical protein